MYSAVNVFVSTFPVAGTCGFHSLNSFVVSLYFALAGTFPVTSASVHGVFSNTSMYAYLFVPSIVLFSPASNVTLTRPVGTCPGFAGFGTTTVGFVGVVPPTALYSAVNVFVSTFPVAGTCGFHSLNSFVVSLYFALAGTFPVTSASVHGVFSNTSMYAYLFVPSIVLFSPASNVTLTRPVGTVPGVTGFGTTTFSASL